MLRVEHVEDARICDAMMGCEVVVKTQKLGARVVQVQVEIYGASDEVVQQGCTFLLLKLQGEERRTLGEFPRKALGVGTAGGEIDTNKMEVWKKVSAIEGFPVAIILSGFMRVLGGVRCGGTECRAS